MREDVGFRQKKSYFMKKKKTLHLEIERKHCSQLMRKYSFLAPKTPKYMDFSMDSCYKVAELVKFSKIWASMAFTYFR